MRIAVVGATGMAGRAVVREATRRGHEVRGISRSTGTDVLRDEVTLALAGSDAVVLSVRFPPGSEHLVGPATARVLDAAERVGVRVLVIGGAAPLESPAGGLVVDDPRFVPPQWRTVALASLEQLRVCREHPWQRWTYLSPSAVFDDGEPTGGYRRGQTRLLVDAEGASRVSASDLALAVLDELETPGADRHLTVASLPTGAASGSAAE